MSGGHIAFSERIHGESSRSLPNDATCLRNQIAQLREQLAKAEAEAKRYREAWEKVIELYCREGTVWAWEIGEFMDTLITPVEQ